MRRFYVGFEFTHDKQAPHAVMVKSSRVGPVKRWVDAGVSHLVDGKLRERVGLLTPLGFRFRKDEVKNYLRAHNTWADAKFMAAMLHAEGKYLPHVGGKPKPKTLVGPGQTHDAQPRNSEVAEHAVPTPENAAEVAEGSPAT